MIFWPFCAFIWFKNIEKMLLQMTSGFLQLESTLVDSFLSLSYLHCRILFLLFFDNKFPIICDTVGCKKKTGTVRIKLTHFYNPFIV
jgi:hypothetical protein